ncbi:MAG: SURF1-like protein [Microbacteriaceae bacterium]|nr:SURF1-like protein [Microbacteriaceae bacterium]
MRIWRLALTRRWLGYLGLAVLFAVICVALSLWQVARTNEARAGNQLVDQNFNGTPRPLTEILPSLRSYDASDEWQQVSMSGSYLAADQLLVRNRPLDGNPGFEVLVPLKLQDGSVFIVDRGWVPTGNDQDAPDSVPKPPAGQVEVIARVKAGEPTLPGRSAGTGQVATIHLPTVAKLVGDPTYTGAYGLMVTETPATATRPREYPEPQLDEGLHVSYAIQWVLFGVMAFLGLAYAIRQEYRIRNADDPEERERADERERRKAAKPRPDSEIEDELLDAR